MSKGNKIILNIILAVIVLIAGVQIGLKQQRDQINYKHASFIYNEEILCYKELVQTIEDYQFEMYNDTVLMAEDIRAEIDYFEEQLDSIYSVNKPL